MLPDTPGRWSGAPAGVSPRCDVTLSPPSKRQISYLRTSALYCACPWHKFNCPISMQIRDNAAPLRPGSSIFRRLLRGRSIHRQQVWEDGSGLLRPDQVSDLYHENFIKRQTLSDLLRPSEGILEGRRSSGMQRPPVAGAATGRRCFRYFQI